MGQLNKLSITIGKSNISEKIFDGLFPSFFEVEYTTPSEYIAKYWKKYLEFSAVNKSLNGKIFEYIIATLCIREEILPLYMSAKVAFVPNVIYDIMFYTTERGPVCLSLKTSLRERYKQADLEAIALKYVHRKALCYLITLEETETKNIKEKIKNGDLIGLDDVILADSDDFNKLIAELKSFEFSDPPTINVIESNQVITKDKVNNLK